MNKKTIFALSSPQGKSAVAIIRISGPSAYKIVGSISSNMPKKPGIVSLNKIYDKKKSVIDQTITTYFKAPKSFTGEDVVEITVHGGSAVIKKTLSVLSSFKETRLAEPGEFTRRAFENNKLDLTQVEAIADVVDSETEMQRKQAISHLSGDFFKKTKKIFENLKKILADIEAVIDFSDEDLPSNLDKKIKEQIENNILIISKMLKGSNVGISIRNGFIVAILGKPNTGKSSFLNVVSGKEIAIVTNQPGTTRDLVESFVDIKGYPIRFVDTAGIRKSKNLVEEIGVNKAIMLSKESNINLVFIEKNKDKGVFKTMKNTIFIKSKQDLSGKEFKDDGAFNISSKTEYGINEILEIIKNKISNKSPQEDQHISRERHIQCLKKAKEHLLASKKEKTADLFAEDIRLAIKNMKSLFGSVDIEDILDIIFKDFCIGK